MSKQIDTNTVPESILALDEADPLAAKRLEFLLPDQTVYLDGNSLGPLPFAARDRVSECLNRQWGEDLISSWNLHDWIDLPITTGEKIANLLGAAPGQVICCDSISVNLFKLLACALAMNPDRNVVLSETGNFPTDLYMVEGLAGLLGSHRCRLKCASKQDIVTSLNDDVAVLMLTQVDFRSGEMFDIGELTDAAHAAGALVIWDLAHSAGAMPLAIDDWQVDFAIGCGYKYLNGGPGSPAFLYVAEKHHAACQQPLSGWMGHTAPFDFDPRFQAAAGIRQFLAGTPNILSLAALDGALDVFADVSMQAVRKKSLALTELFIKLTNESPGLNELQLQSPINASIRGSHLAYSHSDAFAISQALIEQRVIVDFRAPDTVRFGFAPLYQRYQDIWLAVKALAQIIQNDVHKESRFSQRDRVT